MEMLAKSLYFSEGNPRVSSDLYEGNPRVSSEFQSSVMRGFDISFDVSLHKFLTKSKAVSDLWWIDICVTLL